MFLSGLCFAQEQAPLAANRPPGAPSANPAIAAKAEQKRGAQKSDRQGRTEVDDDVGAREHES
jgi:hypothetical protein